MDMDTDTGVSVGVALGPPYQSKLDRTRTQTQWWAGAYAILPGLCWRVDSNTLSGLPFPILLVSMFLGYTSYVYVYSQLDLH